MVVFLAGGESRFMDAMINKLNKDGHRVYLLTGSRNSQTSYQKVFEKYNFEYDSDSVREILVSANPDVVIFMGAQDTRYDWENARRTSVQFTADLTNLISAYSSVKKGRFLYLSSQEVFGKSYLENVKEEEPVSATSFRALALAQGEEICKNYYNTRGMQAIVVRIDHLYGTPRKGKIEDKLDFYLLYVLLFAIVYGQQQAIFSALLATAGYCFRQMYDKTGFEVLLDYNTYVWMAQLFIVGMVVGYMKDQIRNIRDQDADQIQYLNGQLGDMSDINDSNVRMKHTFERQIVNQKDSLGKIYEITSQLDQREPEEVLFYAAQVLSKLMDTQDAAIYTIANRDYARLFSFTSQTAKKLGKSIRYSDMKDMYDELMARRVYINKTMDNSYPLMACAVYSEDQMQTILMLWGLPWERMNLAEANRLTVVGYLIQNAIVRAGRYLEALRERRYVEDSDVLGYEAFRQLVNAFFDAQRHGLTECCLLKVQHTAENFKETAQKLEKKLRQTDYFGVLADGLYVLLPNTDDEDAKGVIERFRKEGFESSIVHAEDIGE